jgi:hypothetical protein
MRIRKLRFLLPWYWQLVAAARVERVLRQMQRERSKAPAGPGSTDGCGTTRPLVGPTPQGGAR